MLGKSLYESMHPSLQWAIKLLFKQHSVIISNFATYHSVASTPFQGQSKRLWIKIIGVPLALVCLLAELPYWFHQSASIFKR